MKNYSFFNKISQILIPVLTITGQIAVSLKFPQYGLIFALMSQPFWLFSSWKSYKEAGQIGILVTTIIFTLVTLAGVINYWFLN